MPGAAVQHYIPDHDDSDSKHQQDEHTPGGDHDHSHDRQRDEELKRVYEERKKQSDLPRKPRGK